ncbi:MAG: helix-turn-helix domain-containing protein [Myxococcota bacterium]
MTRRPRTARTRRRLLEAGRTLFARHGAEAVTSHAIAAEAGFASGTFYLHFKHKQALFQELADEAASELESRLAAAAASDSDPRALAQAQSEALVGFAEDHRDLFRIVFRPGGAGAETGARVLDRLARGVRARRRTAIALGQAAECLDADVLAQAIVGMWVRVLHWWVEDPTRASRADVVRTLVHVQLHGTRSHHAGRCALDEPAPGRASGAREKRPRGARKS